MIVVKIEQFSKIQFDDGLDGLWWCCVYREPANGIDNQWYLRPNGSFTPYPFRRTATNVLDVARSGAAPILDVGKEDFFETRQEILRLLTKMYGIGNFTWNKEPLDDLILLVEEASA